VGMSTRMENSDLGSTGEAGWMMVCALRMPEECRNGWMRLEEVDGGDG